MDIHRQAGRQARREVGAAVTSQLTASALGLVGDLVGRACCAAREGAGGVVAVVALLAGEHGAGALLAGAVAIVHSTKAIRAGCGVGEGCEAGGG